MAEALTDKTPSLSEQYALKEKEEKVDVPKPSEVKDVENSENAPPAEVVVKSDEPPADQGSDNTPTDENNGDASAAAAVEDSETDPAAENDSGAGEEESSGDQESTTEAPEIKLETAPVDFRFPTTNQTRHCFTRYVEYHRCTQAKGDGAPECDKFAKYYRSLCPSEWVEKWNEQRENGTFPGPL